MYNQEELEPLLAAVYRLAKWIAYDNITTESAVWEFISELMDEAAYMDSDRYSKAQEDGIREALQDGATINAVEDAGYEVPDYLKTDEEPRHA